MSESGCDGALVEALHDGRLGGAARHRVERHLVDCAGCQQELDWLVALDGGLAGIRASSPAIEVEGRWQRLLARRHRHRRWLRVGAGMAAALLAGAMLTGRDGPATGGRLTASLDQASQLVAESMVQVAAEEAVEWVAMGPDDDAVAHAGAQHRIRMHHRLLEDQALIATMRGEFAQ